MVEKYNMLLSSPLMLNVLEEASTDFWMGPLGGILERYPFLEYPHRQSFYMLLYVEAASGEVIIDKEKIRLDHPKVVIIKPGFICSLMTNRMDRGTVFCFTDDFFSLRYNDNILTRFSLFQINARHFVRISEEHKTHLDVLTGLIKKEYMFKQMEQGKVLRSYLNILLFDLERLYNPHGTLSDKTIKQEKISHFESLIDDHFQHKKLPSDYAELLNISTNYLNKICKEVAGIPAGELIRKRVMLEAKRLLQYTNKTIKEVSFALGFESASYFITFFRKQTGSTPEQFRKMSN